VTFLAALRRLPKLETAILVIAVAVLVWLAVATAKQQQAGPGIDSFSSYDSASGGYRAFYQLLGKLGVRVDRFERRPAFLDKGIDTLDLRGAVRLRYACRPTLGERSRRARSVGSRRRAHPLHRARQRSGEERDPLAADHDERGGARPHRDALARART
jgi:hypothetical protein